MIETVFQLSRLAIAPHTVSKKIDSQHDDARLDHIQLTPFVEMIGHEIHLRFHYGARAQESQSQT